MSNHIKTALQWGVIGGLGTAIFRFIVYFISPISVSNWENAYYLPLIFCMVWGTVTAKRENESEWGFGKAFLTAFIIGTLGAYIDSFVAFALFKWIDPDLRDKVYRAAMQKAEEQWEQKGLSEEQQEAAKKWMNWAFNSPWMMAILVGTQTIISSILSLLIAAFASRRNNNNPAPVVNDQTTSN